MVNSKIDERTLVPVGWVLGGIGIVVLCAIRVTFFFSTIDARLRRLEEHEGLLPYEAQNVLQEEEARAAVKHENLIQRRSP